MFFGAYLACEVRESIEPSHARSLTMENIDFPILARETGEHHSLTIYPDFSENNSLYREHGGLFRREDMNLVVFYRDFY